MASLPIQAVLPEIQQALAERHELVLEAPPGAGKTTRVPLALLDQRWLGDSKIIMLEPRRIAARSAAVYMAGLLGESVGETVGYRMRLQSRVSSATRIEVVTDGILLRLLESDPSLSGVGVVIFDEFHERNIDSDQALSLLMYGRQLFRDGDPLRVIVMSATLDGLSIAQHVDNAPVVRSEGRAFDVDIIHAARSSTPDSMERDVVEVVVRALHEHDGSVLCFLPGQGEIRRVHRALNKAMVDSDTLIAPLYGDLDFASQQAAIAPANKGQRKVVLATTIAESSLTIEGIRIVVDSGYTRVARYDPATAMTRLHTVRVSRASARQRAGRAGRLEDGVCYRLWSLAADRGLSPFTEPEITQADLAPLALSLFRFGVDDHTQLKWLTEPPAAPWQQALDLLQSLEAIAPVADEKLAITARGEQMAGLGIHPRLANMLVHAVAMGLAQLGSELAVLLTGRDVLPSAGVDLHPRLRCLRDPAQAKGASGGVSGGVMNESRRLLKRYRQLCERISTPAPEPVEQPQADHWIGCLLALAYPDRIARLSDQADGRYQLANGRAARLHNTDSIDASPWLAVAELGGRAGHDTDVIYRAVELDETLFDDQLHTLAQARIRVEWPQHLDQMIAQRQSCIGSIVRHSEALDSVDAQLRSEVVLGYVRKAGLGCLNFTDETNRLRQRVGFVRGCEHEDGDARAWPDLSDEYLINNLSHWLQPWIDAVSHVNHLARVDVASAIAGQLDWQQTQTLNRLAPERYRVPTGSQLRLDYSQNPPVLAVKLQELFGLDQTPTIGNGVMLKLHILSPAGRPIQVTQDLKNFWHGSYIEVAKEMRGRYPKHHWPADPMSATPTRHSRRRTR